jgi:vacuolar-type H+-ATPase subunit I/STV1
LIITQSHVNGKVSLNNIIYILQKYLANFHELVPAEDQQYQRRLNELRRKCEEKDKEIDELERKYLAKIVDLLILTQVHCEIKTDINKTFDDLGISIKEVEKEKWIEEDENSQYKQNINDGASYQSFKNNE